MLELCLAIPIMSCGDSYSFPKTPEVKLKIVVHRIGNHYQFSLTSGALGYLSEGVHVCDTETVKLITCRCISGTCVV